MIRPEAEARRPRDICLETWSKIAQAVKPAGFSFVGGRVLRRPGREFREEIAFQSSVWNRAGVLVVFRANAILWHRDLGHWRAAGQSPVNVTDWFAGKNLPAIDGWDWNVVDPERRSDVIEDVTNSIERHALPWFAHLNATETLISEARVRDVPDVDIDALVEYLVFLDRRQEAEQVLRAWINRSSSERVKGFAPQLHRLVSHYTLSVELPAIPDTTQLEAAAARLPPIQYVDDLRPRRPSR